MLRRGFTFLETLIVVGLFSIISVSLFQTFTMGLKIWKRASSPNFSERRAILGMERLAQEVRRIRPYAMFPFSGSPEACSFAVVMNERIYNVSYEFDSGASLVRRRAVSVQDALGGGEVPPARSVMTDVKKFFLSYYGYDVDARGFDFFQSWNESAAHLPYAVKASLELEGGKILERIITIPVSGGDD